MDDVIRAANRGRPLRHYKQGDTIHGNSSMGLTRRYEYTLACAPGEDMDPRFKPALTPAEMLFMGVFEGKYLNDSTDEFPCEWFLWAAAAGRLSPERPDVSKNYFGVKSRQPLSVWRENMWTAVRGHRSTGDGRAILADPEKNPDERGWFQWYCRYWMGRRLPELDAVQIGRWRSFARHAGAIRARCSPRAVSCSPKERQALLQWAYNPFI